MELPNPLTYKYNHIRIPIIDHTPILTRERPPISVDIRYVEYTRRYVYSREFGHGAVWTSGDGTVTHGPAHFENGTTAYIQIKGEA